MLQATDDMQEQDEKTNKQKQQEISLEPLEVSNWKL